MSAASLPYSQIPLPGKSFDWLLVAVSLAMLPHISHIPIWLTVFYITTAVWRWWAEKHRLVMPKRWQLALLSMLVGIGVLFSYGTLLGRDAGVALLVAMLAPKLLESRTQRDGLVLVILGYFLIIANLLYSQSIATAIYLLGVTTLLVSTQTLTHRQHNALPAKQVLRLGMTIVVQSLPIMLILFVLFPRIPGPLWGMPEDAHSGKTGLDDEMTPGDIGNLIQSDDIAFRVRFHGPTPAPQDLYWRGPVLWYFDGRTWSQRRDFTTVRLNFQPEGGGIAYSVFLEPHGQRWLYGLEMPATLPDGVSMTPAFQLRRRKPVNEVIRYNISSYTRYNTGKIQRWEQMRNLQLPEDGNPQARQLAEQWFREHQQPEAIVEAALTMFRREAFYYTLSPGLLGQDSVDDFLFNSRQGFCEHYASSFVFLMRAAQIPARVVTGYQGGEHNDVGNYFMVRQSDAHAWTEVWLEGKGWTRVDPTAAVAPERVEQGLYAAVDNPGALPLLARRDNPWIRSMVMSWDSVNNAWNEWVLAYGPDKQRDFFANLGFGNIHNWQSIAAIAAIVLSGTALGLVTFLHWRRRQLADPLSHAYRRFCQKLARYGLIRQLHEGPLDFCDRAAVRFPDAAGQIRAIGQRYAQLRFGPNPGDQRQLIREVRHLKLSG